MRLVLAIDGSTQANDALHALAHFAPPEALTLVHVVDLSHVPHRLLSSRTRNKALREADTALRNKGLDLFREARAQLPSDFLHVEERIEAGSPAEVILDIADSRQADMILLGARGLGPVRELILGSVSHRVVLHAACSTLVVKSPWQALDRLLLAVQGPDDAERLLAFLEAKPFRRLPEITVLTVCPRPQLPPWPLPLPLSTSLEQEAVEYGRRFTEELAGRLSRMGYPSRAAVEMGIPAPTIAEHEQTLRPDLVVLASHGTQGLSRFLLGSVSMSVLHQVNFPVLIVRSGTPRAVP